MKADVLMVGSVPLRPAAKVFEALAHKLGDFLPRIPDGDQHGWMHAVHAALGRNDALELDRLVPVSVGGLEVPVYSLRKNYKSSDLRLGPYGFADVAAESYVEFKRLRAGGVIPYGTRFQVTMPGAGTCAFGIQLPADELLPLSRAALDAEVKRLADRIPAEDLTIQFDLGLEAEHEEYRRRPGAFATPIHEVFDWTLEQMADSAAWLSNRVPGEIELGFHICSIWHHYQAAGQDNNVMVDIANAVVERVSRSVGYIHIPTIPEHEAEEFAPLRSLRLPEGTRLYLGIIHQTDGIEGARRRASAAKSVFADFGVASFCGLGGQIPPDGMRRTNKVPASVLRGATPDTLDQVLDLHRAVADAMNEAGS